MMKTMKLALLDLGPAVPNNLQYINFYTIVITTKEKKRKIQ